MVAYYKCTSSFITVFIVFETFFRQSLYSEVSICKYLPVFALSFFTYLPESQIYKFFLFIQTNSFIIFTCPNSSFICPRLRESGLARRLIDAYLYYILATDMYFLTDHFDSLPKLPGSRNCILSKER